jgi:anti-anti-sigma factor
MSLDIQVSEHGAGIKKVDLRGRLDTLTAPELDAALAAPALNNTKTLVFDMAGLDYISSAGLRCILVANKAMKANMGRTCILSLQPQIRKVFEVVRALPDVPIFKDDAEMDDYLDLIQRRALGEDTE